MSHAFYGLNAVKPVPKRRDILCLELERCHAQRSAAPIGDIDGAEGNIRPCHIDEAEVFERFLEQGRITDHFRAAEGKRIEYQERIIAAALGVYMAGNGVKALSQSIAAGLD